LRFSLCLQGVHGFRAISSFSRSLVSADICRVQRQDICCAATRPPLCSRCLGDVLGNRCLVCWRNRCRVLWHSRCFCLQTQEMTCLQTYRLPDIPNPGFRRFGDSKTEWGHHLKISGVPRTIFAAVILVFRYEA